MNFAQAKRAVAEAFRGHATAVSRKHWPNHQKCRVYIGGSALIGAASNWKAAVEMAIKAGRPVPEVVSPLTVNQPTPDIVLPSLVDNEPVRPLSAKEKLGTFEPADAVEKLDTYMQPEAAAGYKPGQAPQGDDPMVGGRTKMGNMLVVDRFTDPATGHRMDKLSCGHLVDKTEKKLHEKDERWCNVCHPRKPRSKKA